MTYETIFYAVILGVLIDEPTILDPEVNIPLLNFKPVTNILIVYLHACSDDRNCDGNSDTEVCPEEWVNALKNILPSIKHSSILFGANPIIGHCFVLLIN